MIKMVMTLVPGFFIILCSATPVRSADNRLAINAAEYICTKAKENNRKRIAVYSFTDSAGETSSESRIYSTKIISLILEKKEFRVIDPETIPEVVKEQEKGLTGLVDPETAAETGKLLGADTLVFGTSGGESLQVRMIDAKTGEVIGATIEEKNGKADVKNDDYRSPEGKKKFIADEFSRNLNRLYNNRPFLYLYLTASGDSELAELENTFPVAMKRVKSNMERKNSGNNSRFERRKKKLADFRNQNPSFDSNIRKSRKSLIEQLKEKRKK